jgi:hypothetical protein
MQLIKYISVVLFFWQVSTAKTYSQVNKETEETGLWRIVERTTTFHFSAGPAVYDSCYFSQSFLRLYFDKKSKLKAIEFSDNADTWLKEDLEKTIKHGRFNYSQIDSIAKKEKIKNTSVIFPFIVCSWEYPCKTLQSLLRYDPRWFSFGGNKLKGSILLTREIRISII